MLKIILLTGVLDSYPGAHCLHPSPADLWVSFLLCRVLQLHVPRRKHQEEEKRKGKKERENMLSGA